MTRHEFWNMIASEHGLEEDGTFLGNSDKLEYINVYFNENKDKPYTYKARAILADLDSCSTISKIICPDWGVFKEDNIVCGITGTNYNWAKGYYATRPGEQVMNAVRKEAEAADCMQGIEIVHSLAGGTGAGFGSLLAQHMIDEYPCKILRSYGVLPMKHALKKDRSVICYNIMLTIPYLIECIHGVVCIDDKAVSYICDRLRGIVDNNNKNYLISTCMSGITASLRFPSPFRTDLNKLHVNMVPFRRMHFFVPGHIPLVLGDWYYPRWSSTTYEQLITRIFKRQNMLVDFNPEGKEGKFFTVALTIRKSKNINLSLQKVDEKILHLRNKLHFVDSMPQYIKTDICSLSNADRMRMSITSLSNTTAIQKSFTTLSKHFQDIFQQRKFVHLYTDESMNESDFLEAHETMQSLISEYQEHYNA